VEELTKELANGVMRSKVFLKRKFSDKLLSFIKSIGASFTVGSDGLPSVDIIYHDRNQNYNSLEELFHFLNQLELQVVFAIDEFQQIKKYDNPIPLEGKLRSITQNSNNIIFIFSGSEQHLLNEIFTAYSMPFYQSTRMLSMGKIDESSYFEFILKHFKKAKKDVNPTVIEHVLSISHLHTYYVQAIANYLFSLATSPTSIKDFDLLYRDYIQEKGVFYSEIPELLTKQQFSVLKAVAKIDIVSSPNSANFMELAKVRSPSSMNRAINALLEKQMLIKDGDGYRLYDVFLAHYLKFFGV
jgi:hypothetical protein